MCRHGQVLTGCSGQMIKQGRWDSALARPASKRVPLGMSNHRIGQEACVSVNVTTADALSCSGLDRLLWADAQAGKAGSCHGQASTQACPSVCTQAMQKTEGLCLCRWADS